MASSKIKENAISRLINTRLYYNATNNYFPIPTGVRKPTSNFSNFQLTLVARNRETGALYTIWYDYSVSAFRIGSTISGNAPSAGQSIDISYIA